MGSRGKFIVFEGLDGSGKSTQLLNLKRRLVDVCKIKKCVDEREPDDGVVGLITRGACKKTILLELETIAILHAASRYEHISKRIIPQLDNGNHVLCDRYYFSNYAYNQTENMSLHQLLTYNEINMKKLRPDVTFYLDLSAEESAKRRSLERVENELFEETENLRIVKDNYFESFELLKNEENIVIIDASQPTARVFEEIWLYLVRNIFSDEDLQ